MKARFQFGNIVVVDHDQIGVIVKTWEHMTGERRGEFYYKVYVRSYNKISEYYENEIEHYIYNKELAEDEVDNYV